MRDERQNSSTSLVNTRVLVVVPEVERKSTILRNLEKLPVTTYVASSSYEALGMSMHEAPFDIAVISHPLDDMDSGKLAHSLQDQNKQISFLLLSRLALTNGSVNSWPNELGTTVSLTGDITSERLHDAMRDCLSVQRMTLYPKSVLANAVQPALSLPEDTTSEPLIDLQILEATAEPLGGLTQTWLTPFLDLYSQQSNQLMKQIRDACQTKNCSDLVFAAHTLKSSSAALGLIQISKCCQQLERYGRTKQVGPVDKLLSQLESIFNLSYQALEKLTVSLPA